MTVPSCKPLTFNAAVIQLPLVQGTDADTEPTSTSTLVPLTEQLPETL